MLLKDIQPHSNDPSVLIQLLGELTKPIEGELNADAPLASDDDLEALEQLVSDSDPYFDTNGYDGTDSRFTESDRECWRYIANAAHNLRSIRSKNK